MNGRRIAIATGGTAGHVRPALAFADAYSQLRHDLEIVFIGTPAGFEGSLVSAHGYRFETATALPVARVNIGQRARALLSIAPGIAQARRILRAAGAELVIGFGGYASVPPLLAARSMGLHTVAFECNVVPGLANRLLGRLVDRVGVGLDQESRYFPSRRTIATGMPMSELLTQSAARKLPRSAEMESMLLVTGGSQGSVFLNQVLPPLVRCLADRGWKGRVLHQSGANHAIAVRRRYAELKIDAVVEPFLASMTAAYEEADFVIAGAGASTLAELAAYRLPALLVPLSVAAWSHQIANASAFARATGLPWTHERDWHAETVAARLLALWADPAAVATLRGGLARMAKPEAARDLAQVCEDLLA